MGVTVSEKLRYTSKGIPSGPEDFLLGEVAMTLDTSSAVIGRRMLVGEQVDPEVEIKSMMSL